MLFPHRNMDVSCHRGNMNRNHPSLPPPASSSGVDPGFCWPSAPNSGSVHLRYPVLEDTDCSPVWFHQHIHPHPGSCYPWRQAAGRNQRRKSRLGAEGRTPLQSYAARTLLNPGMERGSLRLWCCSASTWLGSPQRSTEVMTC